MQPMTLAPGELASLAKFDTSTICNALNYLDPSLPKNFTSSPDYFCAYPELPPMVGYARTAKINGAHPSPLPKLEEREYEIRYWEYVKGGAQPTISVIQDIDNARAGYAAIWGDINAGIH